MQASLRRRETHYVRLRFYEHRSSASLRSRTQYLANYGRSRLRIWSQQLPPWRSRTSSPTLQRWPHPIRRRSITATVATTRCREKRGYHDGGCRSDTFVFSIPRFADACLTSPLCRRDDHLQISASGFGPADQPAHRATGDVGHRFSLPLHARNRRLFSSSSQNAPPVVVGIRPAAAAPTLSRRPAQRRRHRSTHRTSCWRYRRPHALSLTNSPSFITTVRPACLVAVVRERSDGEPIDGSAEFGDGAQRRGNRFSNPASKPLPPPRP